MFTSLLKISGVVYLSVWMVIWGMLPVDASAMLAPADLGIQRSQDLQRIQTVLQSKQIAERLSNLGFTPDEVQERLNALSDQDIHNLALQLDGLQIGSAHVLIILIVVAVVIILALMFVVGGTTRSIFD